MLAVKEKKLSYTLDSYKVKTVWLCPTEYKALFTTASCSVTISVGQPKHESEKFLATVRRIDTDFKSCNIMVCDLLQRHTLHLMNPALAKDEVYALAEQLGSEWIERNMRTINTLHIPTTITRWAHWLEHPDFSDALNKVEALFNCNSSYETLVSASAKEFFLRLEHRLEVPISSERAMKYSIEYLLEECATMLLWAEHGYNFEVYPSSRNSALEATFKHFIQPYYPHLLQPIGVKFKKLHFHTN
jgi:hypothetical protein